MNRLPVPYKKTSPTYRQIWRIVDGALADTLNIHDDYFRHLRPRRRDHIRSSIVKRITGQVHGYLSETEKGRSGAKPSPAVDSEFVVRTDGLITRLGKRARKLVGLAPPASTYSHEVTAALVVLFAIAWLLVPLKSADAPASTHVKGPQILITGRSVDA